MGRTVVGCLRKVIWWSPEAPMWVSRGLGSGLWHEGYMLRSTAYSFQLSQPGLASPSTKSPLRPQEKSLCLCLHMENIRFVFNTIAAWINWSIMCNSKHMLSLPCAYGVHWLKSSLLKTDVPDHCPVFTVVFQVLLQSMYLKNIS